MKFFLMPLWCFCFLLVAVIGCDQGQQVLKPVVNDVVVDDVMEKSMPRWLYLGWGSDDAGNFVELAPVDISQMRITHTPDSIFVIGTHIVTGEVSVLYTAFTPAAAEHVSDVMNSTMDDLKLLELGTQPRSADQAWMNEKLILGIATADRFDGTDDNEGWVDADKVLSDIKSNIIFQDARLGNAKLNFEFASDWSIGRDFIGIHVSKDNLYVNTSSSTSFTHYDFELQTIGGVRYIRYTPNQMSSEGSPRILVDNGSFCKQLVVEADAVSIEYEPDSIFVIGTYIADGRKVILYQGKTPGAAELAFSLLRNVTEDIDIRSAVSKAGEEYLGEWNSGDELRDRLWLTENYAEAIVGADALDGNIDGWAIAELATARLVNRIKYHPSGFESASLIYEVKPPNQNNRLYMRHTMRYVVDELTKGIESCGWVSGSIRLDGFQIKIEDNILYRGFGDLPPGWRGFLTSPTDC